MVKYFIVKFLIELPFKFYFLTTISILSSWNTKLLEYFYLTSIIIMEFLFKFYLHKQLRSLIILLWIYRTFNFFL